MSGYRGRGRTAVGHRYLDVLHLQDAMDIEGEPTISTRTPRQEEAGEEKDEGLNLLILGMTLGTAMDDIDIALCRFSQADPEATLYLEILHYDSVNVSSKVHTEHLTLLQQDAALPSMLSQMDVELGHLFANAVHEFAQRNSITVDEIDLIGSGGHLVSLSSRPAKGQHRSNICLGEGATISAKTGITTVCDYCTTEQAVGRQGAPLFSHLVGLLLQHPTRLQISITIGSIATVCLVPAVVNGGIDAIYDWDTGPGTVLIEAALQFYGLDPHHPSSALGDGMACQPIIDEILNANEYLELRPPKTTARETFNDEMAYEIIAACQHRGCSTADTIATVLRITTASITQQLLVFGPSVSAINNSNIILDGGGVYHSLFLSDLRASFPGASFDSIQAKTGLPAEAQKAVGFAMQAMEAMIGRALPVTANADVRRPNTITGKISPGVKWRGLMEQCIGFGGGRNERGWEGLPEVRELRVLRREEKDGGESTERC